MINEANTCRLYVLPKLKAWEREPHLFTEQYSIDAVMLGVFLPQVDIPVVVARNLLTTYFATPAIFLWR